MADEVRAIRVDTRLQREIADAYGLTASAVSLLKARKCRGDVPNIPAPAPKPAPIEIRVTVCPPARSAGHKSLAGGRLKPRACTESGKLSGRPTLDVYPDSMLSPGDVPQSQSPAQHYADDWFFL